MRSFFAIAFAVLQRGARSGELEELRVARAGRTERWRAEGAADVLARIHHEATATQVQRNAVERPSASLGGLVSIVDIDLTTRGRRRHGRSQKHGGRDEAGRVFGADGLGDPLLEDRRQGPGRPLDLALVEPDPLGIALADDAAEGLPLAFALLLVEGPGVPGVLEQALGVGAGDVQALDALARTAVEKDQDLGDGVPVAEGDHGLEDGIEVVLVAGDDPHVDAGLAHEPRQERLQALGRDAVDDVGLLADGQDGRRAPVLRGRGRRGGGQDERCGGERDEDLLDHGDLRSIEGDAFYLSPGGPGGQGPEGN